MKKEIKIDFKSIKNSPYTIIVVLAIVAVAVSAVTIWLITDIEAVKTEIIEARKTLQTNVEELANLEELRVKSEDAEAKLKQYDDILPDKLDDIYVLEEELADELESFGLTVVSKDETIQESSATIETKFNFTVSGSYEDFLVYMQYVNGKTQIERIDKFVLTTSEDGTYTATMTLTVLSQSGAEGLSTAVEEVAEDTEASE